VNTKKAKCAQKMGGRRRMKEKVKERKKGERG